jgi:hypothetical protein
MPVPIQRLTDWGLRGIDRVSSSALLASELKVEELEEFDESFDELFEKVAAVVPCLPEKDAAFLRWRYGPALPNHLSLFSALGKGRAFLATPCSGYLELRRAIFLTLQRFQGAITWHRRCSGRRVATLGGQEYIVLHTDLLVRLPPLVRVIYYVWACSKAREGVT